MNYKTGLLFCMVLAGVCVLLSLPAGDVYAAPDNSATAATDDGDDTNTAMTPEELLRRAREGKGEPDDVRRPKSKPGGNSLPTPDELFGKNAPKAGPSADDGFDDEGGELGGDDLKPDDTQREEDDDDSEAEKEEEDPERARRMRKRDPKDVAKRADRMVRMYVLTYAQHLESPDWIKRAMAMVSLSRIDDPRVTEMLFTTLRSDRDKYVRLFAFVALAERVRRLSDEQRRLWRLMGRKLAVTDNVIHGRLRPMLLRAVAGEGPTRDNQKLFLHLFSRCNLLDSGDIETLDELQTLIRLWKSNELKPILSTLVRNLGKPSLCYRCEYVLRGLDVEGAWTADDVHQEGDRLEPRWKTLYSQYATYLKKASMDKWAKTAAASQGHPKGPGLLARPETLDPDDPSWRKDLELPRLNIDALSMSIVMDATGSMKSAIAWVKQDVERILRAMKLISREPSIGITFYRDQGEEFLVRAYKQTASGKALATAIRGVNAKGGGDFPEAVYAALKTALSDPGWPKGHSAGSHKVLVVVGDAPPHSANMGKIKTLLTTKAKEGYRTYCLKVRNADYLRARSAARANGGEVPLDPGPAFDSIAKWCNGKSMWADFSGVEPGEMVASQPAYIPVSESSRKSTYLQLMTTIFEGMVNPEYRNRVKPFMVVLLETLQRSPAEVRTMHPKPQPKPPRRNPGGGGRRPRPKPKPPVYEQ